MVSAPQAAAEGGFRLDAVLGFRWLFFGFRVLGFRVLGV